MSNAPSETQQSINGLRDLSNLPRRQSPALLEAARAPRWVGGAQEKGLSAGKHRRKLMNDSAAGTGKRVP